MGPSSPQPMSEEELSLAKKAAEDIISSTEEINKKSPVSVKTIESLKKASEDLEVGKTPESKTTARFNWFRSRK